MNAIEEERRTHTKRNVKAIARRPLGPILLEITLSICRTAPTQQATPSLFMAARRDNWKHNGFCGALRDIVSSALMRRYLSVYVVMLQEGRTVTNDLRFHLWAPRNVRITARKNLTCFTWIQLIMKMNDSWGKDDNPMNLSCELYLLFFIKSRHVRSVMKQLNTPFTIRRRTCTWIIHE